MPDDLHADELDDRHLGCRIRVDGYEGVLRAYAPVDDSLVQLLLVDGAPLPVVPIVGAGTPVQVLDSPPV